MPIRTFTLFHLSLVPIRQPNFQTQTDLSREDWIRAVLSERFIFPYRGGDMLYWVPLFSDKTIIVGIIEKSLERLQHLSPDMGGLEIKRQEWQGAYVIIDPTHHEDGQKMAVENDIVGTPHSLSAYLAKYINSRIDRPFEFEPNEIFDSNDYLEFIVSNGPQLKYIKFHFVIPNMWNSKGKLDKGLRETGIETGTEEVDLTFKSRRGLDGDSDRVLEGVDYAANGAGSVRAKAINGQKFNSFQRPTTSQILTEEDIVESPESWVYRNLAKILGRE